jgi:hypothetical protein
MDKLSFASIVHPNQYSEKSAVTLASSIRSFGGKLAQLPIYYLVPQHDSLLASSTRAKLSQLNVVLIQFDISSDVLKFPLASDVIAASIIETALVGKTDLLVWLGTNTIILQEPKDFLLSDDKNLGYRPVHHINIGSLYSTPLDKYWTFVYQYCNVSPKQVFPMTTHIDQKTIRPYFNAGCFITRPDEQLCKQWHDIFSKVYQNPELLEMYKQDNRYPIFIHQVVLSGIVTAKYNNDQMQELPDSYNYPLHLYPEDKRPNRPANIDELITLRYETFADLRFSGGLVIDEKFKKWIADVL